MPQLTTPFTESVNGQQHSSTGLIVHRGKLSIGPPGIGDAPALAGDINANRGNNQGAYYFGGGPRYLYFDGTQFVLYGGKLNVSSGLAPGTAQALLGSYNQAAAWSTPAVGTYYETPVQVSATSAGVLTRLECGIAILSTAAAQGIFMALGIDGGLVPGSPLVVMNTAVAGHVYHMTGIAYVTPTAGARRFGVFLMTNPGTVSLYNGCYQWLHVTEQRA